MHAIDLAGLANVLVHQAAPLIALQGIPGSEPLHHYWLTCRYRHESWTHHLSAHRQRLPGIGVSARRACWREIVPIIQEVLISEPLARSVGYLAAILDDQPTNSEFSGLAASALAAHVEARNRCLHLMVFGQGLPVEDAVKLNRLRRTMEGYNDQLLATMKPIADLAAFCFDSRRVTQSQIALARESLTAANVSLYSHSVRASLHRAVQADVDWRVANPRLNNDLGRSVLKLFPDTAFDHLGLPKTRLHMALEQESSESTGASHDRSHPLAHPLSILLSPTRETTPMHKMKPRW